jgi:PelA/Pel-15E family pectate lyase
MISKFNTKKITLIILISILICISGFCLDKQQEENSSTTTSKRTNWSKVLANEPAWFGADEAKQIADNVLLYQRDSGGWPKNLNMTRKLTEKEEKTVLSEKKLVDSTIDNGSTFPQMRFLAKVFNATGIEKYREGFYKGFNFVIKAQYPNGGWPQFYPLRKGYYSHITYNDNAMTGVMFMLRDIAQGHADFSFMTAEDREIAKRAADKGLDIILKTQIEVNGKLTGWCAQHDEVTLKPADARSYELASISGMETVALVEFLMTIENPSEQVIRAIQSACAWFEEVKITGFRIQYEKDKNETKGFNRLLVEDQNAEPLWARFYDIETNQPMYIDRGGIRKSNHNELSAERRNGYAYIGDFASNLLYKKYPKWKKNHKIE